MSIGQSPLNQAPDDAGAIYAWTPAGFDPVAYLGDDLRRRADLARFVVHKIIWGKVFRLEDKHGYVPLKAEYLRSYFPGKRVYAQVMRRLIESGVILCDGHYIKGEKSFGYRLNPELSTMRQQRVALVDRTLAKKIVRERRVYVQSLTGVYRHLYDHLCAVEIDHRAAIESILGEDYESMHEAAIQFIRDKQFRLSPDEYGRVHTNLTNLKGSLRRFLHVRGESLVNLDIRNSQPLIFASILKQHYEFNPEHDEPEVPPDVLRYVQLVQEGRFYDYLMEGAGIPAEARATFKKDFFKNVFYCRNEPVREQAVAFGDLFPSVYGLIRSMKADDYAELARTLQRRESSIIIGDAATRCMAELPHVFIATIHDSIVTTPAYAEAIKGILVDAFRNVDLAPTINVERT